MDEVRRKNYIEEEVKAKLDELIARSSMTANICHNDTLVFKSGGHGVLNLQLQLTSSQHPRLS